MAELKTIEHKTGMETATELADRNESNIEILAANQEELITLPDQVKNKQDKLTAANAGKNVTITEEEGIVKINAAAEIPTIDGDSITATINGQNKLIKDAISANETASTKNTNDIKTLAESAEAVAKQVETNKNDIASQGENLSSVSTQVDLNKKDVASLKTDKANQSDLANKMNVFATGVTEFSDTDFSASGKFVKVQDGYNANFHTEGKTISSAINDTYDQTVANKTAIATKVDSSALVDAVVTFKDGTTGTYQLVKKAA